MYAYRNILHRERFNTHVKNRNYTDVKKELTQQVQDLFDYIKTDRNKSYIRNHKN